MNTYPQELVTPPLALVALLGCPQLHPSVGEYLRSQHRPPINSLGVAEPWAASRLFGERKGMLTAPKERAGILKAGWFAKHRKRRPAVAVLFLERKAVTGDPNAWATACSALETVKNAARARSARMVVVVIGAGGELPEERTGAISRISGVDKKYVVLFNQEDGASSMSGLGKILYEAAGQYYLDSARRQLNLHAERRGMNPERSARVNFKAAALAEFRADWATAVKTYQSAYAEIARVPFGPEHPMQRAFEVAAVAEQIHIKVITLLLHQFRLAEALAQFKAHMSLFRQTPFESQPAFAAAHWGWVSRQYAAMGELMTSRTDLAALKEEASPLHFFLWAAQAAVERRVHAQKAASLRGGRSPQPTLAFAQGEYVGQYMTTDPARHLTETEFLQFLEGRESRIKQGALAVEALDVAQEACAKVGKRASRQAYYIGRLLAREQMCLGDYETAFRLLLPIAGIYRREGWQLPLVGVGEELCECAQHLGHTQEQIMYSLELASLELGLPKAKRQKLAESALQKMTSSPEAGKDEASEQIARLHVLKLNHPLQTCFGVEAGFQALPESDVLPKHVSLSASIRNCLPINLPIQYITATVKRTQGSAVNSSTVRMKAMVERQEIEPGNSMLWKAEVDVNPGDSFQLTDVTLHINTMASVTWSLDGLPGSTAFGAAANTRSEAVDRTFTPGLYEVTIPVSVEPPRIEISRDPLALVGEQFQAQLEVLAAVALTQPRIKVFGGFMEGKRPVDICMTPTEGATWRSAEPNEEADDGSTTETFLGVVHLETIPKGSIKVVEIELQLSRAGQLRLAAQLEYDGHDQESSGGLQASTDIEVITPFALTTQYCTAPQTSAFILPEEGGDIASLPAASECYLTAHIRNQAPTQVQIRDVKVFPAEGLDVRILCDHFCKGAVSHELRKADSFMTVFNLQTQKAKAYNSAGSLLVSWRRSRGDQSSASSVETRLVLPALKVLEPQLEVHLDVVGRVSQGVPFPLRLQITNRSSLLQPVKLAVSDASGIAIAGKRHDLVNLVPNDVHVHNMSLVAYNAGRLVLPQCRVLAMRHSAVVEPLAGREITVSPRYGSKDEAPMKKHDHSVGALSIA